MSSYTRTGLFIRGEWVTPQSKARTEVINPATEELIGIAPEGNADDVSEAIAAAREAFDKGPWPRMAMAERVRVLRAFLDHLQGRAAEITELIVKEAGSTVMLAQFLQFGIPMKHAYASLEEALRIEPKFAPLEVTPNMAGTKTLGTAVTVYDPVGVVSAITPYNFPFFLNIGKLIHAMVMGNTTVLKPSPFTPFEGLILGDAAIAAGIPAGVLNIVTGDVIAGQLLTTDKRVDMVTFTGSDKVGAAIMGQAAPTLKRLHLELGGKSALIVRADANLMEAAQAGLGGFTIHTGQGCALMTRHLVHNSIRARYVETVAAMAAGMKIGNPVDPSVHIGPMIREQARQRVEHYVDAGLAGGARLVTGGKRPAGLDRGFFYQPTLFDNVDNRSKIAQEEIFGPVGVVIGFDTDDEAIAIANDSDFGLHGGIYSANVGLAYELALQIRSGGVAINGGGGTMLSGAPFGGVKRSGIGREYGREGLLDFANIKSVSFHGG